MISQNDLQVIVFSKDRPWQLKEYLRTFRKYISQDIKPVVIWTDGFTKAYEDLWKKGWANPVREQEPLSAGLPEGQIVSIESPARTFKELVISLIKTDVPYILFGTDDVVWYRPIRPIETIKYALVNSFGFSCRLAPNITFCQPANNINKLPQFQTANEINYYDRRDGWGDFDYPFELGGTIYKTRDILPLLQHIEFNNPNQLESEGAKLFMGIGNPNAYLNSCETKPCCSVITINRVQNDFPNPLSGLEHTPEELLELYWKDFGGWEYDDEWYAQQTFDRIHIGDFNTKRVFKDIIWEPKGGSVC